MGVGEHISQGMQPLRREIDKQCKQGAEPPSVKLFRKCINLCWSREFLFYLFFVSYIDIYAGIVITYSRNTQWFIFIVLLSSGVENFPDKKKNLQFDTFYSIKYSKKSLLVHTTIISYLYKNVYDFLCVYTLLKSSLKGNSVKSFINNTV